MATPEQDEVTNHEQEVRASLEPTPLRSAGARSGEKKDKEHLVLVDGSGYIFRAYHGLPPLTRGDGTPVGAVYGFTNMLLKLKDLIPCDHMAVIFDAGRYSFRNEMFADYKANRDAPPEDLVPQFALVREATKAMALPCIEQEGFEADDIIASYAVAGEKAGMEVTIVSSDKDLMQLITDNIRMWEPMKQRAISYEQVKEKFGVMPDKVVEVQALIGDKVDNVPGVPGIGPKTAAELIDRFGDLETTLQRAEEVTQNKRRESLIEHAEAARLSRKLVELKRDMELPEPIESFGCISPDPEVLIPFLREQNFSSLVRRMEGELGAPSSAPSSSSAALQKKETTYTLVQDEVTLQKWIRRAIAAGKVAVDTETTGLDALLVDVVGVSLAIEPFEACYIPLAHVKAGSGEGQGTLFAEEVQLAEGQMDKAAALALLKPMLEDPTVLKIGQNIKYDMHIFAGEGINVAPIDDTMVLSYVQAAGVHNHNMDELSQRYLEHTTIAFKDVVGTGKNQKLFSEIEIEKARDYAAEDADVTLRLHSILKEAVIEKKLLRIYEQFDRPLISVLTAMEAEGILVDKAKLQGLSADFESRIEALSKDIYQLAGREFTIGSPKQLGEVLFDELGLEGGKKSSKTGAYATGAEVLEELAVQGHQLPEKVLQWRQLSKLKSTYTDALVKQINPNTGRVHTSYTMTVANTGRLSSTDPNLQNIPIRTEEGRKIRTAFIAREGYKLIGADYSQIELRLLAHMADMDVLRMAFKEGKDIHATTASQMFGVPVEEVDSELRRKAKTINFGIIYGISAHGLAQRLGIGRKEAAEYIEAYFEQYPGIRNYMERTKEIAHKQGYVETLYGRRVHLKDIASKNPNLRQFSERAAINAPLQGTAADIIKRAMVQVYDALAEQFPNAKLLLQVHDELIVEAPEAEAEAVSALLKKTMQNAAYLSVPLTVDAAIGHSWDDVH